jgi:DNA-binding transcriptional MerR regulator
MSFVLGGMGEYKIRDLEQLTGIKAHTIRIWEQRYKLLEPSRSSTSIRFYTDKELSFILKVSILNKNGIKISRIAEMSVNEINEKIFQLNNSHSDNIHFEKMLLALVQMDENLFVNTLSDFIEGTDLETSFESLIIPFLDKIGVMWVVGSINPAQEHFVTNLIRQKIIVETDKLFFDKKKQNLESLFFLYLPENEWHELGILFYNYFLRKRGYRTIYLGQSLPIDSLCQSIEKYNPTTLVTSIVTAMDENMINKYFNEIHSRYPDLKIYSGGYQIINSKGDFEGFVKKIHDLNSLNKLFS